MARVLAVNGKYGESSTDAASDMSTTANVTWSYHVWHMRTWKGPVVDTSLLSTPYSECGVTGLLKDWDYFLTGKKGKDGEITVTSCDFVVPSTDIIPEEHDLLMELMRDPKKCEEKDDEKGVKEDENSVKENDERTLEDMFVPFDIKLRFAEPIAQVMQSVMQCNHHAPDLAGWISVKFKLRQIAFIPPDRGVRCCSSSVLFHAMNQ
ncbi:hypothetical protein ANCDUO_07305 [Ancylostoma duodenale]|uniref:Uncharacterized protein n=1 Tax=Ancylostoma duodenale TaxID=51022 RepID=A0A0C2CZE4_9BILA|nr:hypothetical protein ANCDUO_07305 [Ancylostoma duodenale]